MKQYNLGPNGGIMTSLNLFSTKFVEVSVEIILTMAFRITMSFFSKLLS